MLVTKDSKQKTLSIEEIVYQNKKNKKKILHAGRNNLSKERLTNPTTH